MSETTFRSRALEWWGSLNENERYNSYELWIAVHDIRNVPFHVFCKLPWVITEAWEDEEMPNA